MGKLSKKALSMTAALAMVATVFSPISISASASALKKTDYSNYNYVDEANDIIVHIKTERKFGHAAQDLEIIGRYYTYTLDSDNNAIITGLKKGYDSLQHVIPEKIDGHTVVGIADGAFAKTADVTDSTLDKIGYIMALPSTIRWIGDNAFKGRTGLVDISLPKNLESIGNYAFANCTNLRTVCIDSPKFNKMGCGAFLNCESLSMFYLTHTDGEVNFKGNDIFKNCTSLQSVSFNNPKFTDNVIGRNIFYNCDRLKRIKFGMSMADVNNINAFKLCKGKNRSLYSNIKVLQTYDFNANDEKDMSGKQLFSTEMIDTNSKLWNNMPYEKTDNGVVYRYDDWFRELTSNFREQYTDAEKEIQNKMQSKTSIDDFDTDSYLYGEILADYLYIYRGMNVDNNSITNAGAAQLQLFSNLNMHEMAFEGYYIGMGDNQSDVIEQSINFNYIKKCLENNISPFIEAKMFFKQKNGDIEARFTDYSGHIVVANEDGEYTVDDVVYKHRLVLHDSMSKIYGTPSYLYYNNDFEYNYLSESDIEALADLDDSVYIPDDIYIFGITTDKYMLSDNVVYTEVEDHGYSFGAHNGTKFDAGFEVTDTIRLQKFITTGKLDPLSGVKEDDLILMYDINGDNELDIFDLALLKREILDADEQ